MLDVRLKNKSTGLQKDRVNFEVQNVFANQPSFLVHTLPFCLQLHLQIWKGGMQTECI